MVHNLLINRYKFDHFAMLLTRVLAISDTDDQRHQEVEFEKDFHDGTTFQLQLSNKTKVMYKVGCKAARFKCNECTVQCYPA